MASLLGCINMAAQSRYFQHSRYTGTADQQRYSTETQRSKRERPSIGGRYVHVDWSPAESVRKDDASAHSAASSTAADTDSSVITVSRLPPSETKPRLRATGRLQAGKNSNASIESVRTARDPEIVNISQAEFDVTVATKRGESSTATKDPQPSSPAARTVAAAVLRSPQETVAALNATVAANKSSPPAPTASGSVQGRPTARPKTPGIIEISKAERNGAHRSKAEPTPKPAKNAPPATAEPSESTPKTYSKYGWASQGNLFNHPVPASTSATPSKASAVPSDVKSAVSSVAKGKRPAASSTASPKPSEANILNHPGPSSTSAAPSKESAAPNKVKDAASPVAMGKPPAAPATASPKLPSPKPAIGLEGHLKALALERDTFKAEVAELKAVLADAKLVAMNAEKDAFRAEREVLDARAQLLQQRLDEANMNTLAAKEATLKAQTDAQRQQMRNQVLTFKTDIDSLKTQMSTHSGRVETLEGQSRAHTSRWREVQDKNGELDIKYEHLQAQYAKLEARLVKLERERNDAPEHGHHRDPRVRRGK